MIVAPTTQTVIVASQQGMYPNYATSSSICLGIFHLIVTFVLFVTSVAGVAVVNNTGGYGNGAMVSSLVFSVLVST